MQSIWKNKEIIILVVIAFVVRLYKIDSPVADWHSFRQADTASVTRMYLENGVDLLVPRYHDVSSAQSGLFNPEGYRFVEFPLFNMVHYFAAGVNGLSVELSGRLVSVFFSILALIGVYVLGKRFSGKWAGVFSGIFLALSAYSIYFSRVIMPDYMAICLGVWAVVLYELHQDKMKWHLFIISTILMALGVLVKPFIIFYLPLVLYIKVLKSGFRKAIKSPDVYLFLILTLMPFILWRVWISNFPEGIPRWGWMFNYEGIRFRPSFWRWIFGERIGQLILGVWGLVPFGMGVKAYKNDRMRGLLFFIGVLVYVFVFAAANVRHDYYQLVLLPPIALIVGIGFAEMMKDKVAFLLGFFCMFLMFLLPAYTVREFYKINHPEIIEAGTKVSEITEKDALIIAPYNGDTAFLYQTGRSGWPVVDSSFEDLINRGADYYVSVNLHDEDTKYIVENYEVIERTDRYIIAKLE